MHIAGPYDYIIVGAGTAGCVLANRLTATADVSVLLLEAGGSDNWIWIHIPVGYLYCIGNPRTDWCYRTEAEPGLNGRSILYARGKVLGGSSSINAMLYLRGQARDYDEWARITGDKTWAWDHVLPIFNVRTLNAMVRSLWGKAKIGLEYALLRTGPLSMAPSQLGAFAKSDSAQATPNLEFHVQPLSLDKFGDPLHRFDAFTASVCNLRPTSRGSVRIKSADPCAHPAIAPNYLATDQDRNIAVAALRLTRRIVSGTRAMQRYAPEEFMPGTRFASDAELVSAAGNVGTTIFHPVGTCKMGPGSDAMSVVSPDLRVSGIESLRVIDASVMPTITSGNTNSPTLMIAEKGAVAIAGKMLA